MQDEGSQVWVPSDFVVPILGYHEDGVAGPFIGTGSFVEPRPFLLTCDHVLDGWSGRYGVVVEKENQLFEATVIERSKDTDLALLEVRGYRPPHYLSLESDNNLILNDLVTCFEYGTTMTAGHHINFSPANRIGNVTRFRNLRFQYGEAGNQMLELSFPALKGASGSPVMGWRPPFKVWGIVAANISSELLPVQIESVFDENGLLEESTKYLLPQALAIHVKHVRGLLASVQ